MIGNSDGAAAAMTLHLKLSASPATSRKTSDRRRRRCHHLRGDVSADIAGVLLPSPATSANGDFAEPEKEAPGAYPPPL